MQTKCLFCKKIVLVILIVFGSNFVFAEDEYIPFNIQFTPNSKKAVTKNELLKLISDIDKIDTTKIPEVENGIGEIKQAAQELKNRPALYSKYYADLSEYLINALRGVDHNSRNKKVNKNSKIEPCASTGSENKKAFWYSMVPFKKGDLYSTCDSSIKTARDNGFTQMTMFFPVHYSGGNAVVDKYPLEKNKDYFYETVNGIDNKELNFCLDKIFKAGMKLNYIPHLESIITMNSKGESEWRMKSLIPIDENYYENVYGPIEKYLSKKPENAKLLTRVSLAAEIDAALFLEPQKSLKTLERLRSTLKQYGAKDVQISWNPNGDFYHLSNKSPHNCNEIAKLLNSVDRVSHSAYQESGHIPSGTFNYEATKTKFYSRLQQGLNSKGCSNAKDIIAKMQNKPYSFGEFHLDKNPDYAQVGAELLKNNSDATFWNSGKWDVVRDKGVSGKSLREFLGSCNSDDTHCQTQANLPLSSKSENELKDISKKMEK